MKALASVNSDLREFPLEYTRNIGVVAHIDAGKTTTTERILYYTGVVHKMGEVHEGAATTDWMEQERERGITITSAAISCSWINQRGLFPKIEQKINLIDTPGHVDFTAEVERSLRVLDGAIGVFCAVAGVQPQSETVWRQMNKYQVPRVAFINKMDRMGADYFGAIKSIREKLGANAHPLFLPIGDGEDFEGLIDLVKKIAYQYQKSDTSDNSFKQIKIPISLQETSEKYRDELIEALSDFDDELAENYLDGREITEQDLQKAVRKATLSQEFIGVIPGSAFKNKGIQMLLDAVVDYLPSPLEVAPMTGFETDQTKVDIYADDSKKVTGLAFKLASDSFVGKLVFFRMYTGVLKKGAMLYNPRTQKKERISRLMVMHANDRQDIDTAFSGDICAVVGVRDVATGDTLCDPSLSIALEPPTFPEPVISMSVEPNTTADQDKLALGLKRLSEEDPTFKVSSNTETGQTIIGGMGELHLEIICDRLFREFKVEATAGRPQIAYRETISNPAIGIGKFIRQSGGRGQYGHAEIKLTPLKRGAGFIFENHIIGGSIPKEFIQPTKQGIIESSKMGILAGYPVVDFKVELVFGSFHEVDSSEMAFKMAGIFAIKDALKKAKPEILEPIMKVVVETPNEYQGDLMGDLNRRRGQIQGTETKGNFYSIEANVPLETMFGYATDVRSLSRGRASYSMEPSHFETVPANILKKIQERAGIQPTDI